MCVVLDAGWVKGIVGHGGVLDACADACGVGASRVRGVASREVSLLVVTALSDRTLAVSELRICSEIPTAG